MTEIPRIVSASVVLHGVVKIVWNDNFAAVVDLRPVLAKGKMFTNLNNPQCFDAFAIGGYGHALVWKDRQGQEIDFGPGSLRKRAEAQAELHRLAG